MEKTLHDLGGLLLRALPTFFLVALLHFYLKYVFFKPLHKVLHDRYEATEGARKRAEESLARASAKTAEYEAAMRAARAEVYQQQDQLHRQLQAEREAEVALTRGRVEDTVKQAKAQFESDIADARAALGRDSELLAEQIAQAVLHRSAA